MANQKLFIIFGSGAARSVDAKENITTLDGQSACYLTITDEKTGSWLCALTFAYGRISQVPVEEVRQRLIQYFIRWGKPVGPPMRGYEG